MEKLFVWISAALGAVVAIIGYFTLTLFMVMGIVWFLISVVGSFFIKKDELALESESEDKKFNKIAEPREESADEKLKKDVIKLITATMLAKGSLAPDEFTAHVEGRGLATGSGGELLPDVIDAVDQFMDRFSGKTGLTFEKKPMVYFSSHERNEWGSIMRKSNIPTCAKGTEVITIGENSMDDKEVYGEEIGHHFRNLYYPSAENASLENRQVDEFFGYLGRKILVGDDKIKPLNDSFGSEQEIAQIMARPDTDYTKKEFIVHYDGYKTASSVDTSRIKNWKSLFSMPDAEVRKRFFGRKPEEMDYSGL